MGGAQTSHAWVASENGSVCRRASVCVQEIIVLERTIVASCRIRFGMEGLKCSPHRYTRFQLKFTSSFLLSALCSLIHSICESSPPGPRAGLHN